MMWLSIAAVAVLVFLAWNLSKRFGADRIADLVERRRASSLMASRGEFVDGNRHLEVALAVTESTFFYENADMQASIDLEWVSEIEYDTTVATHAPVVGKVLRLRCYSQTFEFVLPTDLLTRWQVTLPPRTRIEASAAAAV